MSAYKINVVKKAYFFQQRANQVTLSFSILLNYLHKNCAIYQICYPPGYLNIFTGFCACPLKLLVLVGSPVDK